MAIRIVVCDDDEHIRKYFVRLIKSQEDMEVVGTAGDGKSAVKTAREKKPDIILMDIQMDTEKAGIEAIKKIHDDDPDIKIIIITIHAEDDYIFEAYAAGAVEYILKTDNKDEISKSIRRVYANEEFVRPYIAKRLVSGFFEANKMKQSVMYLISIMTSLTNTELEILRSAYEGKSRKEIAQERFVELNTVKYHITNILKKLHYKSLKALVADIKELQLFELFFKE